MNESSSIVERYPEVLQRRGGADPTLLQRDLRHRDLIAASIHLEATCLIRIFAEFESRARHYWAAMRETTPRTADLLDGLAARFGIPDTQRDNAHLVRNYRNRLVHEQSETWDPIPIAKARSYHCHFFSFPRR